MESMALPLMQSLCVTVSSSLPCTYLYVYYFIVFSFKIKLYIFYVFYVYHNFNGHIHVISTFEKLDHYWRRSRIVHTLCVFATPAGSVGTTSLRLRRFASIEQILRTRFWSSHGAYHIRPRTAGLSRRPVSLPVSCGSGRAFYRFTSPHSAGLSAYGAHSSGIAWWAGCAAVAWRSSLDSTECHTWAVSQSAQRNVGT